MKLRDFEIFLTVAERLRRGPAAGLRGLPVTRYHSRPDVVYLPCLAPLPLCRGLVWRRDAETDPIRALAAVIRDLGSTVLSVTMLNWRRTTR